MAFLELRNVSKAYGEGAERTEVLANVSLEIERGEFVAIVGFSGSGKTTLLSLIAGLIEPDEGEILIDGKRIAGPGPERGVIFQNYSLLPWLTVYGNVALVVNRLFPAWSAKKRRAHVEHYVEMVHLTPASQKRPTELSGGMRQRVAVARALALNSPISPRSTRQSMGQWPWSRALICRLNRASSSPSSATRAAASQRCCR